jgi:hypothetical protein
LQAAQGIVGHLVAQTTLHPAVDDEAIIQRRQLLAS